MISVLPTVNLESALVSLWSRLPVSSSAMSMVSCGRLAHSSQASMVFMTSEYLHTTALSYVFYAGKQILLLLGFKNGGVEILWWSPLFIALGRFPCLSPCLLKPFSSVNVPSRWETSPPNRWSASNSSEVQLWTEKIFLFLFKYIRM